MRTSSEFRIVEYEPRHAEAFRDLNLSWIEEYFEVEEIDRRLDRLDRASTHGAWTRPVLATIADHPARRAGDLAQMHGRETKAFKTDVRKLKNLGLTTSLDTGYRLSPRGAACAATVIRPQRHRGTERWRITN